MSKFDPDVLADLQMAMELHRVSPDGEREIAEKLAEAGTRGTVELSGQWEHGDSEGAPGE